MSTRSDILAELKTAIETVGSMKTVEVNQLDTRNMQDTPLPAAWIFSGAETRAGFIYRKENWDWDVIIHIAARDTDMEALLASINTAIYTRYQSQFVNQDASGVTNLFRSTSDLFILDSDSSLQEWTVTYKIFYNTDKGTI